MHTLLLLLLLSETTVTPPAYTESIVVSAIRADEQTPVTKTDIPREEIEARYHGQDVPLLLRDAPSVQAYAESGVGGAGYSYITLRGVSASRINFTLDGVPLADSEDMATYFADFPDLARSLESIQIQRGVGTSTVGSPSFGGSVNMESIDVARDSKLDATLGLGSFGNRQASVGWHSGVLPGDVSLYARVSYLESDGFRDNSAMRQRNIFFSGIKELSPASRLKLTGFSGHEDQQLSFFATDADTLDFDLRANPLRDGEKDSFGYDLAQLQYLRALDDTSDLTASVYYQRGYGWYRLFDFGTDVLRQYGLDGLLLGSLVTYSKRIGSLTTNYGVHVNRFEREHTRDDLSANARDYANFGVKAEANAFAKATWQRAKWTLYGDAQLRHTTFDYHGDIDVDSASWTFFNPKIGARYALGSSSSIYASAGLSTREPARNDFFHGDDNPSIAYDIDAVRPERVFDIEAGWNRRFAKVDLAANLYAMEFRNEIAATGELSDIGLPLRRNVSRSYRRGVELDLDWRASSRVRLKTTANLSRNRIQEWTQHIDQYNGALEYVGTLPYTFQNVEPLLTPNVLASQSIELTPTSRLRLGTTARYASRSYLDNTNDEFFSAPSYFVLDAVASYAVTSTARITLQLNNALDNDRIYPSGYSYQFYAGGGHGGTRYYYPQATRNAVVLVDLDF